MQQLVARGLPVGGLLGCLGPAQVEEQAVVEHRQEARRARRENGVTGVLLARDGCTGHADGPHLLVCGEKLGSPAIWLVIHDCWDFRVPRAVSIALYIARSAVRRSARRWSQSAIWFPRSVT